MDGEWFPTNKTIFLLLSSHQYQKMNLDFILSSDFLATGFLRFRSNSGCFTEMIGLVLILCTIIIEVHTLYCLEWFPSISFLFMTLPFNLAKLTFCSSEFFCFVFGGFVFCCCFLVFRSFLKDQPSSQKSLHSICQISLRLVTLSLYFYR